MERIDLSGHVAEKKTFVNFYLMLSSHPLFQIDRQLRRLPRLHSLFQKLFLYFIIDEVGDKQVSD